MLYLSTVKYDFQDQLNELQAKIYLDTKIKLSKKELLELVFMVGVEQYDEIIHRIKREQPPLDDIIIAKVLSLSEGFGSGSESLSTTLDKYVYDKNTQDDQT